MDRDRVITLVVVGLVVLAIGLWATGPTGPLAGLLYPLDYEETTVTVADDNGTALASVDVRVADTDRERYIGLSRTDSLAENEGMLFVFADSDERAFVMRDMAFPLDIVYVASNGTITTIHHAPTPEGDDLRRYRGPAQYVLEVPRGFTNRTGLAVGDRVVIPESVR